MCSRFAQYTDDLEAAVSTTHPYLDAKLWNPQDEIGGWLTNHPMSSPRYNVVPKDVVRVLYRRDKQNLLRPMKWGIPIAKQPQVSDSYSDDNYNWSPNVGDKGIADGTWDRIVEPAESGERSQRCVIPVDGFFGSGPPPPRSKSKKNVPYYVKYKDGGTIFLAGLWDAPKLKGKYGNFTFIFAIVTTDKGSQLASLAGERMPVILQGEEDVTRWLDTENHPWSDELQALLRPYEGPDRLEYYQVPSDITSKTERYNNPSCVKPIALRDDGLVGAFKRQAERPKRPLHPASQAEPGASGSSECPIEIDDDDEKEEEPRPKKRARKVEKVAARNKGKEKEN